MAKQIYVLDTSACLTDGSAIKSFGNNDVVLPLKVLDEIDAQKKRQDGEIATQNRMSVFLTLRCNKSIPIASQDAKF